VTAGARSGGGSPFRASRAGRRIFWISLLVLWVACRGKSEGPSIHLPDPDLRRIPDPAVVNALRDRRAGVLERPDDPERWGSYGDALVAYGRLAEAATCFLGAEELDPKAFRWPYMYALAMCSTNPAEAALGMERARRIDPGYAPLHVKYAAVLIEIDRDEDARDHYLRALELDPDSVHALHGAGRMALEAHDLEAAQRYLEQAVRLAPEHCEVHESIARLQFQLGNHEKAREHAELARRFAKKIAIEDPRGQPQMIAASAHDFLSRGLALAEDGKIDGAIQSLQKARELDPKLYNATYNLGLLYSRSEQFAPAEQAFEESLELRPEDSNILPRLGFVLRCQGKLDEARQRFLEYLETDPGSGAAHLELAQIALAQGNWDEVKSELHAADLLEASDPALNFTLGMKLSQSDRLDEAIDQFQSVVRRKPDSVQAYIELGIAMGRRRRTAEAMAAFREVLRIEPDHPSARRNLATGCFTRSTELIASGETRAAIKLLDEALFLRPGWPAAERLLAWTLAVDPDDSIRDPARALELIEHAIEKKGDEDVQFLDTLATVYAANGQFDRALPLMQRALDAARPSARPAVNRQLERRLLLFQNQKPFRAPAQGAGKQGDDRP